MARTSFTAADAPWKQKVYAILFEAETPAGKLFDILLMVFILGSVAAVMLESVQFIREDYEDALHIAEGVFTFIFTVEYILRLTCVQRSTAYAFSFMGVVDLLSILPTYISLVFAGQQFLLAIRVIRLVRVFRVLKLTRYLGEGEVLWQAIIASRFKITVFLVGVLSIVTIIGTVLYMVEGPAHGFTSIPRSIYWAIVTLTTVGYGDIAPQTSWGQFLASLVMVMGYGILAVPTGIVTSEIHEASRRLEQPTKKCPRCMTEGHPNGARFCYHCGSPLTAS